MCESCAELLEVLNESKSEASKSHRNNDGGEREAFWMLPPHTRPPPPDPFARVAPIKGQGREVMGGLEKGSFSSSLLTCWASVWSGEG